MTLQELRHNYLRLTHTETIHDSIEAIDIYCELFIIMINNQKNETINSNAESDALMILQMMMTKALHLKKSIEGVNFKSNSGLELNKIIDPTIIGCLTRNVYETVGMFNIIYRANRFEEERLIVYNLWVNSGLQYRQRFSDTITMEENEIKLKSESATISRGISEIENTMLYKGLNESSKKRIQHLIKRREYLVYFQNGEAIVLNWRDLYKTLNVEEKYFDKMYTFFSLSAHPSNVAVFQFRDMFKQGEKSYIGMTTFNMHYFFMLASIFIADYLNLFPSNLDLFNNQPILNQIIINFHNTFARGNEFSINDSWKHLGLSGN